MTKKSLCAVSAAFATFVVLLDPWFFGAAVSAAAVDQPPDKNETVPRVAEQPPSPAAIPRKPVRVVQFELTDEYDRGLLPPGRRVGMIVRVLGDLGKSAGGGIVAIVESADSARNLISLTPAHDPTILEATTSVQLPPVDANGTDATSQDGGTSPVQMVRVNVTFARLQGMRLEPLFKRRVYLALGHQGSSAQSRLTNASIPGDVQINTSPVSTPAEDDPPSVPGIVDEVVVETDLMHGGAVSSDLRNYWRDLGRRIRHRWAERNAAIAQEKTARPPRIRFRLYPSGVAQTVYLERSSGNVRVDIAGLESVLDTQPFSPLPANLGEPYVNVHIQFHGEHSKR